MRFASLYYVQVGVRVTVTVMVSVTVLVMVCGDAAVRARENDIDESLVRVRVRIKIKVGLDLHCCIWFREIGELGLQFDSNNIRVRATGKAGMRSPVTPSGSSFPASS